jgi:anti-sigma factor RsiW
MVCESWKTKLDTYLDGEVVSEDEMRNFDTHVRSCPSCSTDVLMRVQMKRAIHVAGKRYTPSAEFRRRMQQKIAAKPQRRFGLGWTFAAAAAAIILVGTLTSAYLGARSGRDQIFSEIADLHVVTLASSSPVTRTSMCPWPSISWPARPRLWRAK